MIGLLLVCGQTVWRRDVGDVAVPLGFVPWRRASGEGETCWRKRGVSRVSRMTGGIV